VQRYCKNMNVSVLWATHWVSEVEQADQLIVLHRSHLYFNGHPNDLLKETQESILENAFLKVIKK
jgi:ABC-2 type transport system ATP-binding protein